MSKFFLFLFSRKYPIKILSDFDLLLEILLNLHSLEILDLPLEIFYPFPEIRSELDLPFRSIEILTPFRRSGLPSCHSLHCLTFCLKV
jgi:hypothetical protein